MAEDLDALAQVLQPHLKPIRGPTPHLSHIMAAILIARDSLNARAACRAVPGVPEGAHARVGKLAERVHPLLATVISSTSSLHPPPRVTSALPAPLPQPQVAVHARSTESCTLDMEWDLPPLVADPTEGFASMQMDVDCEVATAAAPEQPLLKPLPSPPPNSPRLPPIPMPTPEVLPLPRVRSAEFRPAPQLPMPPPNVLPFPRGDRITFRPPPPLDRLPSPPPPADTEDEVPDSARIESVSFAHTHTRSGGNSASRISSALSCAFSSIHSD